MILQHHGLKLHKVYINMPRVDLDLFYGMVKLDSLASWYHFSNSTLMEIKGFSQCIAANKQQWCGLVAAASCGIVAACEFFVCKLVLLLLVAVTLRLLVEATLRPLVAATLRLLVAATLQHLIAAILQLLVAATLRLLVAATLQLLVCRKSVGLVVDCF